MPNILNSGQSILAAATKPILGGITNPVTLPRGGGDAGGGAVPIVESFAFTEAIGDANITAVAPAGITAGELLMLMLPNDATTPPFAAPAGWNPTFTAYGLGGCSVVGFHKIATGSEGNILLSSTEGVIDIMAWYARVSGVNQAAPINVAGTGAGSTGTSFAISGVETTVANCLAFYLLAFDGGDGNPFSIAGTGWTESHEEDAGNFSANVSGAFGTKEQATAGATGTATVGANSSDGAAYIQFALAPA